jgi:hypothetical protein
MTELKDQAQIDAETEETEKKQHRLRTDPILGLPLPFKIFGAILVVAFIGAHATGVHSTTQQAAAAPTAIVSTF